jgi:hypothetical protein
VPFSFPFSWISEYKRRTYAAVGGLIGKTGKTLRQKMQLVAGNRKVLVLAANIFKSLGC